MGLIRKLIPEEEIPGMALGRHIEHDDASRSWDVDLLRELWDVGLKTVLHERHSPILDQGDLGSCTGNAMTGALACEPLIDGRDPSRYDEAFAVELYSEATKIDRIPGQYPPTDTGSSGLAVAKAAKLRGEISAYHHAFTTAGFLRALMTTVCIIGIDWYEGFDVPDPESGEVRIAGSVRGGHEVLVRGYDVATGMFDLDNSWGPSWGLAGSFRMSVQTWTQLRRQGADVTVPRR